ncbi:hypothetical protein HLK59_26155, partial [Streptomyces sp. S3(2020)]|uniref:NAD(P)H-dependent flavin oxidoreductase n=1 Tax=Streptomyces sp. S3(2020) TaxID=2732044 RepID=UPI0014876722
PVPLTPISYRCYADALQAEADRYHLALPADTMTEDDDAWADKVGLLLQEPVPLVSFAFGLPSADVVRALRGAGSLVAQTVTTPAEALAAADTDVDLLIVQAPAAGGHSATLTPDRPLTAVALPDLVDDIRHTVPLPAIAAGGIATPADTAAALRAGAHAVMVGTLLLRTHESGASVPHKAALTDPAFTETALTRAFTGRPARALRNRFTDTYDSVAPLGYPALHHLTAPLRRAATAAGDTDLIHLWAGTGHRAARRASSDGSTYSSRWIVAGLGYAAVALVSALAVSRAIPGKGSSAPCRHEWQPCWVNHLYPGAFLVTLASLAATVAVMHWLPRWMPKLRAHSRK